MMAFAAAAIALTLLAVGAVLLGPRLQRAPEPVSRSRANAVVLRQQLAELEGERARGLLDDAEFARAREDLQRRLLSDVDTPPPGARGTVLPPRRALLAVAALLPLAAIALYARFGNPQLLGAPATAPAPAAADVSATGNTADKMLMQLEAHVVATPGDARAWVMLARARMQRDQFEPAATAYARAIGASAKVARDPLIWCEQADALGMAAGGRLAGKPRELIDRALALDPAHPRALEMAGSAAYEAGEFRTAARYWRRLLALMPAGSPEHTQLDAAVARAEQRAKFTLPGS